MTGPQLTPAEVGELLRLHPRVVVREIQRGHLAASKLAGRWRIDPKAVDEYLDASRVTPVSETPPSPAPRPDRLPQGGPARSVRDHVKATQSSRR